jgi:hypothetical protein
MTVTEALEFLLGEPVHDITVGTGRIEVQGESGARIQIWGSARGRLDKLAQLFQHERHRAAVAPTAAERPTPDVA